MRAGTAFTVVMLAAAGPAIAQSRDTTTVPAERVVPLAPVDVYGSILSPTGPASAAATARATIIPASDLTAWRSRLLSDALAGATGLSSYDDLGSGYKTTLVMRGFTAGPVVGLPQGVTVLLDGIPVNEPDAGQVNFDLLPLAHVHEIELLSGTASLLGPHSLGGAVNLVTRRQPVPPGGDAELSVGSHGSRSLALSRTAAFADGWRGYLGGGYSRETGWRDFTSARQSNVFTNVGRAGGGVGFNVQAFGARSFAETAGSLPLSIYSVRPAANLTPGDFEDLSQLHVAISGYRQLRSGQGSANLYFRSSDAERFNVNQENDPDVRSFAENRTFGANADWRTAARVAGGTAVLRLGSGGSTHAAGIRIFAERIEPGLTTHVESPITKLDAYALADYVRGRLALSAGVRLDAVRVPFKNRLNPTRDTTSLFRRASPRLGLSLASGNGSSVYLSLAQSFRAPALIELACADPEEPCPLPFALGDDPPLAPVVATTYEAGARHRLGGVELSGAVYATQVRDDIFLFPYDDESEPAGSTIDGYFANIERTRRIGAELTSRWNVGMAMLYASYGYTRATFEVSDVEIFSIREVAGGENEVEKGDRLPLVPAHAAALGAVLQLPRRLDAGVQARFTGERYLRGDEANEEERLRSYWVTDGRAGWALGRGWRLGAVVRNVLNRRYATFGTFNVNQAAGSLERFLTPGEPRSARFTVGREF